MGVPLQIAASRPDHNLTYSVTLVCFLLVHCFTDLQVSDLTAERGFYASDPRVESNTGLDFCKFLLHLIGAGVLRPGDVLIADNASVHGSDDVIDVVSAVLEATNVR